MLLTMQSRWSDFESKRIIFGIREFRESIETNKKKDYTNSMQKSLKEIYGLVSENLLLAKCKLISKLISKLRTLFRI